MLTGNVQFLRDQYLKLRKIAEYVDAYRNPETGLIHRLAGGSGAYQFGIIYWPSTMRYGYDMSAEARTVISAYAYLDYDIISRIAGVVGNEADQKLYQGKAEAMRQAINTRLLYSEGVYIDGLMAYKSQSAHVSQHANMFPLAMGVVPDAHKEKVIQAVKDRKMNVGMVTLNPRLWDVRSRGVIWWNCTPTPNGTGGLRPLPGEALLPGRHGMPRKPGRACPIPGGW